MRDKQAGTHYTQWFDSFGEYLQHLETSRAAQDVRVVDGANVSTLAEALTLARKGLPREGVEALRLAEVGAADRELVQQGFQWRHAYEGGEVDVARFLSGEQDCMVDHYLEDQPRVTPIVTLAVGVNIPFGVSPSAVQKHGRALVALAEAIDASGLQSEIWADNTVFNGYERKWSGRQAIRLKAPGEWFDVGMFMYMLTHPSVHRALGVAGMHTFPSRWHRPIGVGDFYGGNYAVSHRIAEDFPEGTIHVPPLTSDSQAGKVVDKVLKDLGLV